METESPTGRIGHEAMTPRDERGPATTRALRLDKAGRLDRLLAQAVPELSRSRLQQLIRAGEVMVEGAPTRAPGHLIRAGTLITLREPPPAIALPRAQPMALTIVYEDADLIVVDKPAGLVVHPAPGHDSGTLVNALIAHCGESLSGIGGVRRPGIVHRLDKDTSGLLVVAKTDRAHRDLAAQFADHGRQGALERVYVALVWGIPPQPRMTIAAPLARSSHNREKMAVAPPGRGRRAVTYATLEEVLPSGGKEPVASVLRCRLETGRTHQIRVHLAAVGHPLLGDALYGSGFRTKAFRLGNESRAALTVLGRQALHAAVLGFRHPRSGEVLRFASALPEDMASLLSGLRSGT